jgi:hypothetical protein
MNEAAATYEMNPAEDEIRFGDDRARDTGERREHLLDRRRTQPERTGRDGMTHSSDPDARIGWTSDPAETETPTAWVRVGKRLAYASRHGLTSRKEEPVPEAVTVACTRTVAAFAAELVNGDWADIGPVPDATEDNAAKNMSAFWTDMQARGLEPGAFTRRSNDDYGDGRYAFDFYLGEDLHQVQMPGLPLERVRYLGGDQDIRDFPRLYVDDSSWVKGGSDG